MRVAFIEPVIANVEPLGIAYISQALIDAGHIVRYFEAPRPNLAARLEEFKPDVLAYSVTTGKHSVCRALNAELRKKINAISLFGGPHCTFSPEFIESNGKIDGICRGDGEDAMVDLLGRIERGEDYSATPNWWLRVGGKIYQNPVSDKRPDLDTLPFPNREIIYAENSALRANPIKRVLGSRGCPFSCSYCFNWMYNDLYHGKGKIYRQRSVANIVEEILDIKSKYPFTFLKFAEDIFGMNMDAKEFAEVYGSKVGLPFIGNMRPNVINEEKIRWFKKAGCVAVTLAIESGNDFIRNTVLNRNLSAEVLDRAITILKKEGIRVWTQNIMANPGETFEMAMETYRLSQRHRVDFGECFLLMPYPGTTVHDYCVKNNYFDGKVDELPPSFLLDSCLRFDSKREKRRLINFQKFFSFAVQHPRALPIIKLLILLPPNRFYVLFNRLYDNWRISRVLRAKMSAREFWIIARNNLMNIKTFILKGH